MQRRLVIMRHAKSSWETDAPSDHARPLNKRGRRDAPRIAKRLAELGWQPQLVVSSDSRRTKETYELLGSSLGDTLPVRFLPSLYQGGVAELVSALEDVPDDVPCVLALGHNPGWEQVVEWLCGQHVRLTTANAALLEGRGATWREAAGGQASWLLRDVLRPKEL